MERIKKAFKNQKTQAFKDAGKPSLNQPDFGPPAVSSARASSAAPRWTPTPPPD